MSDLRIITTVREYLHSAREKNREPVAMVASKRVCDEISDATRYLFAAGQDTAPKTIFGVRLFESPLLLAAEWMLLDRDYDICESAGWDQRIAMAAEFIKAEHRKLGKRLA